MRSQTRLLIAALLWLAAVGGCGALLHQLGVLDARMELEHDVRHYVRKNMATYKVHDPAAWQADQHRVDARIAALERQRRLTADAFVVLGVLALSPFALLLRGTRSRHRLRRAR